MELTSLSLSGWYHVLLGLSIELGLAAAFVWMIHVTRSVQLQSAYWTHYLAFLALNYPTGLYPLVAQQTQQDYQVVQQSTNQLGWTAVLVTEVTIAFGGVLLFHWCAPHIRDPKTSAASVAPAEENELEFAIEPLSDAMRGGGRKIIR